MQIKTVCIFCGSSTGSSPEFEKETAALARYLASNGIDLVYGGGDAGLMGLIAAEMVAAGRKVTGIIPEMIDGKIGKIDGVETIVTDGMHGRKKLMYELADAFIALPGGIGTLEEIAEAATWQQLGYIKKPVSLYDIGGFYTKLNGFLDDAVGYGFLKQVHRERIICESEPADLLGALENYSGEVIDKWS